MKIHSLFVTLFLISIFTPVFAQEEYSFNTISGDDLKNNTQAKILLEKIEEAKKILEKLRIQSVDDGGKSLLEKMKQKHMDSKAYLKMQKEVDKENLKTKQHMLNAIPDYIKPIFVDAVEFTEMKTRHGEEAKRISYDNNNSLRTQLNSFYDTAQIKRTEMFDVNSQSNIKYGFATNDEQAVFNTFGKVVLTPEIKLRLHALYSNYKSIQKYILANPNDELDHKFYEIKQTLIVIDQKNQIDADQKIKHLNAFFSNLKNNYNIKKSETNKFYDKQISEVRSNFINAYHNLKMDYKYDKFITKSYLVSNLIELKQERSEQLHLLENNKFNSLYELKEHYSKESEQFLQEFGHDVHVKIFWNPDLWQYQAHRNF